MEINNLKVVSNISDLGKRYDIIADVDGKQRFYPLSVQESIMFDSLNESEVDMFVAKKLLTYNEFKSSVLVEEQKMDNHVKTAYDWHSGQFSPLYSFASTGGKVHTEKHRENLKKEISDNMNWANEHDPKEYKKLKSLHDHVSKYKINDNLKEETVSEEKMTKTQKDKREEIVSAMKDKTSEFKDRYGKRAKEVMYATATKMAMNEAWKRTGKVQKDNATGAPMFEYAEFKNGKFTGKTVYKDKYGKVPEVKAWVKGKIGEEVGSFDGNIGVYDVTNEKPNDQTAWNIPFKHTVYIEPKMKNGVFFGYTLDENGNKIHRIFDNMTQVHEWAASLNADVKTVLDNAPQISGNQNT